MQLADYGVGKISYYEAFFFNLESDSRQTNESKS